MRAILLSVLAASVFAFSSLGCVKETTPDDDQDDGTEAPDFAADQGQASHVEAEYPAGPYGLEIGSIAENYKFVGYPNPADDQANYYKIDLSDFYNPTGDGVFPEGSVHGPGNPKPTVLLITVAAVWCGPCNLEASESAAMYEEYASRGAGFLLQLADGPTVGKPAKFSHLKSWTTKYDNAWPSVIDPTSKLSELFEADAFPANILIDTTTMEIVEVVAGAVSSDPSSQIYTPAFFDLMEEYLKN